MLARGGNAGKSWNSKTVVKAARATGLTINDSRCQ
jgi:hypothetical protein